MASNKFFTIMVVPEKSQNVTKVVIPSYVFKGGILSLAFLFVLATIMVLDYANVMNQINENKQLKVENRQLKQSVQVFKTKMVTIENTMDRVKTFVTKLRIITNIEDTSVFNGSSTLPPAVPATTPAVPGTTTPTQPAPNGKTSQTEPLPETQGSIETVQAVPPTTYEAARAKRLGLLAALMTETPESFTLNDADSSAFVKAEFEKLDAAYDEVNHFVLASEQETQDILERLGEKKTLLASTPTRIPTLGYITSDYGIRPSPFGGRAKMHEGIDIANRYGADIIATADGVVTFAGVKPGYGKLVILDHGNGLETRYAHASKVDAISGERVRRGQRIAAVGNSGQSTGPHCHYEVHANGLPVDPCWYILDQQSMCKARSVHKANAAHSTRTPEDQLDTE